MDFFSNSPLIMINNMLAFTSEHLNGLTLFLRKLLFIYFSLLYTTIIAIIMVIQLLLERWKYFEIRKRDQRPAEFDENGYQHMMYHNKNIKLHLVCKGDKSKPLLLLLHGFPLFWYSWKFQIEQLCDDFYVCAMDLRGYGESDKPPKISKYKISKLIEDIIIVIKRLGHKKATLIGHGFGGILAWHLAGGQFAHFVDKLIVINAPHPFPMHNLLFTDLHHFLRSWYIFFFQLPLFPELVLLARDLNFIDSLNISDRSIVDGVKYFFSKPGAIAGPVNYYRENFYPNQKTDDRNFRLRVKADTLIIWSSDDPIYSLELANSSAKFIDGNHHLKIIDCSSHYVHLEQSLQVNQHVRQFLALQ